MARERVMHFKRRGSRLKRKGYCLKNASEELTMTLLTG